MQAAFSRTHLQLTRGVRHGATYRSQQQQQHTQSRACRLLVRAHGHGGAAATKVTGFVGEMRKVSRDNKESTIRVPTRVWVPQRLSEPASYHLVCSCCLPGAFMLIVAVGLS